MSPRIRLVVLAVVVVLAAGGATGYVLFARSKQAATGKAPAAAETAGPDPAAVSAVPHLAFRNTALGDGYGHVALVPLSDPDGPRAVTAASCDRLYARPGGGICLAAERGLVTRYRMELHDARWTARQTAPLAGLPSRARLSPDGTLNSTTTFVYGDSYAAPGQFSTRTIISRAGQELANVEDFALVVNGKAISAADRNMWGVTFTGDNDTFYATAASGGKTWLVRGSLAARRLAALRQDVECPSLSPDGTRVAFKKHGDLAPGRWRVAVYNLSTGAETVLAEARSVDDQVEWLDNATVVYGLPRTSEAGAATSDLWAVAADGSGTARVLVRDAWSPAVVRPQ